MVGFAVGCAKLFSVVTPLSVCSLYYIPVMNPGIHHINSLKVCVHLKLLLTLLTLFICALEMVLHIYHVETRSLSGRYVKLMVRCLLIVFWMRTVTLGSRFGIHNLSWIIHHP